MTTQQQIEQEARELYRLDILQRRAYIAGANRNPWRPIEELTDDMPLTRIILSDGEEEYFAWWGMFGIDCPSADEIFKPTRFMPLPELPKPDNI